MDFTLENSHIHLYNTYRKQLLLIREVLWGNHTKKTPIIGMIGNRSEKSDKQKANRAFRCHTRTALSSDREPPFNKRQTSNVWDFSKDGKQWLGCSPNLKKWIRK